MRLGPVAAGLLGLVKGKVSLFHQIRNGRSLGRLAHADADGGRNETDIPRPSDLRDRRMEAFREICRSFQRRVREEQTKFLAAKARDERLIPLTQVTLDVVVE
jgi:hypothetical protein